MWQRFTERARKVVFYAQEEAQKWGEGYVSTEHLLLGLVREPDAVAAKVLDVMGVSLNRIRAEVEKQLARSDPRARQDFTLTPRGKRVIELAYDEARNLNNNYIGTEHLLLGLIRQDDGLAGRILAKLGLTLEHARREVMALQDSRASGTSGPRARQSLGAPGLVTMLTGTNIGAHLVLVLLADENGVGYRVINRLCSDVAELQLALQHLILSSGANGLHRRQGESFEDLLSSSIEEAGKDSLAPHHFLLALLRESATPLGQILSAYGLTLEAGRAIAKEAA